MICLNENQYFSTSEFEWNKEKRKQVFSQVIESKPLWPRGKNENTFTFFIWVKLLVTFSDLFLDV